MGERESGKAYLGDASQREIFSIDEITALYPGRWILMKVIDFNEHHDPFRGEILARSLKRSAITKALAKRLPLSQRPPDNPFYIFKAVPRLYSGEELRQAILKEARQGIDV